MSWMNEVKTNNTPKISQLPVMKLVNGGIDELGTQEGPASSGSR